MSNNHNRMPPPANYGFPFPSEFFPTPFPPRMFFPNMTTRMVNPNQSQINVPLNPIGQSFKQAMMEASGKASVPETSSIVDEFTKTIASEVDRKTSSLAKKDVGNDFISLLQNLNIKNVKDLHQNGKNLNSEENKSVPKISEVIIQTAQAFSEIEINFESLKSEQSQNESKPKVVDKLKPSVVVKVSDAPPQKKIERPVLTKRDVSKRLRYVFSDLLQKRSIELQFDYFPELLKMIIKSDHYLCKPSRQKIKQVYQRSKNAWVNSAERFKSMSPEMAEIQEKRMLIQKSINKFNSSTMDLILSDLKKITFDEDLIKYLIDCMYRSIIRSSTFVSEFSKLCLQFFNFLQDQRTLCTLLKEELVRVFSEGCVLSKEWVDEFDRLQKRPVKTIEELDILNEEIEGVEQIKRAALLGCGKFFGQLFVIDFCSVNRAETFLKQCINDQHPLSIEFLCCYFSTIISSVGIGNQIYKFVDQFSKSIEENISKFQMRIRFIIKDFLDLYKNKRNKPVRPVVSTTLNPSTKIMMPVRNSSQKEGFRGAKSHGQYSLFTNKSNDLRNRKPDSIGQKQRVETVVQNEPNKSSSGLDLNEAERLLVDLFDRFMATCDISSIIYDLKDFNVANHMEIFVQIALTNILKKPKDYPFRTAYLLLGLRCDSRLLEKNIKIGFSKFLENYQENIIDCPMMFVFIARCSMYLLTSSMITIDDYYKLLKDANIPNSNELILELMTQLVLYLNQNTIIQLWRSVPDDSPYKELVEKNFTFLTSTDYSMHFNLVFDILHNYTHIFCSDLGILNNEVLNCEEDKFREIMTDFVKLLVYCCPSDIEENIKQYFINIVSEYFEYFSIVFNSQDRINEFYKILQNIIKQNYPTCPFHFVSNLSNVLISLKLFEYDTLESIFPNFYNDDYFSDEFSHVIP